jgi:hypothetical protein
MGLSPLSGRSTYTDCPRDIISTTPDNTAGSTDCLAFYIAAADSAAGSYTTLSQFFLHQLATEQ